MMLWRILLAACSAGALFVIFKLVRLLTDGSLERSNPENIKAKASSVDRDDLFGARPS